MGDLRMKITRAWAMPNAQTFHIKPIAKLIVENLKKNGDNIDPFAGQSPFKRFCTTNDLDENEKADFHIDALDFLKSRRAKSVDLVLFDPPYSPRQVSEVYRKLGRSVNMQTTQASFWSAMKKEIGRCVRPGGKVITCGWNSGGIGKKYGFAIEQILIVAHGGWHNDTIVTVEKKQA